MTGWKRDGGVVMLIWNPTDDLTWDEESFLKVRGLAA
jgi:hypothetical protein